METQHLTILFFIGILVASIWVAFDAVNNDASSFEYHCSNHHCLSHWWNCAMNYYGNNLVDDGITPYRAGANVPDALASEALPPTSTFTLTPTTAFPSITTSTWTSTEGGPPFEHGFPTPFIRARVNEDAHSAKEYAIVTACVLGGWLVAFIVIVAVLRYIEDKATRGWTPVEGAAAWDEDSDAE